jgi:hypothetical protein
MTLGTKPLTSKPGEFYARCNLPRVVKCHLASEADKAEAKTRGLQRHQVDTDSRNRPVWAWKFPACEGFETTDREAYAEHLEAFHGGGTKLKGPWLKIPAKLWTGPRLTKNGDDRILRGRDNLQVCSCGLVAEVTEGSPRDELWWREHRQGCRIAMAGAAS